MLLAEQETLRVDCHQARAAANYSDAAAAGGVLSVCSLLTVETGLYGGSTAVMRDASSPPAAAAAVNPGESTAAAAAVTADDRDVRSRCSARHFIAWSQEVTDKCERLKVSLAAGRKITVEINCRFYYYLRR